MRAIEELPNHLESGELDALGCIREWSEKTISDVIHSSELMRHVRRYVLNPAEMLAVLEEFEVLELRPAATRYYSRLNDDGDVFLDMIPATPGDVEYRITSRLAAFFRMRPADNGSDGRTGYKSPPEWRTWLKDNNRPDSPTSWRRFKTNAGGEDHPVHGDKQVRFSVAKLRAEGLEPPQVAS